MIKGKKIVITQSMQKLGKHLIWHQIVPTAIDSIYFYFSVKRNRYGRQKVFVRISQSTLIGDNAARMKTRD